MTQTHYIYEGKELIHKMTDRTSRISDFHIIRDNAILLQTQPKKEFIQAINMTNIFIAVFTTCLARRSLYYYIDLLGHRCLYTDTDSVIYTQKPCEIEIPFGDHLGAMTNELKDKD